MKKNVKLVCLILGICSITQIGCIKDDRAIGKPTDFHADGKSTSKISLSWFEAGSPTGFKIERKSTIDNSYKEIITINNPSAYVTATYPGTHSYSYTDSLLEANTIYSYRLTALQIPYYSSSVEDTAKTFSISAAILPNITIGTQVWGLQNLAITTYRNGDPIPQVTTKAQWIATRTGAWCYFNFDSTYGPIYGKIYNRFAVDDTRGLAPIGWRIPSSTDWYTLRESQGGKAVAGDKLKSTTSRWTASSYSTPSNTSGFTGVPGGFVTPESFNPADGGEGTFWTSTDSTYSSGSSTIQGRIHFFLYNGTSELYNSVDSANTGYSVRVIKN